MKNKGKGINELIFNKSHFIKFSEKIGKNYGFDVAVLIGLFMSIENMFESDDRLKKFLNKSNGYFYCMAKYVNDRNGMSIDRFRRAVSIMENAKMISTKKWAKNWKLYKINHEELSLILLNFTIESIENKEKDTVEYNKKLTEMEEFINELERVF